jgi:hypothetical protein
MALKGPLSSSAAAVTVVTRQQRQASRGEAERVLEWSPVQTTGIAQKNKYFLVRFSSKKNNFCFKVTVLLGATVTRRLFMRLLFTFSEATERASG